MLHAPTLRVSTQAAYIARTCAISRVALSHSNVTEPPAKSVNRRACFELPAIVSPYARSMLGRLTPAQAIYRRLQTAFAAGLRSWVALRRCGTQLQPSCELLLLQQSYFHQAGHDIPDASHYIGRSAFNLPARCVKILRKLYKTIRRAK